MGVVVGDFDVQEARPLIARYFGRLESGPQPPPVVTLEMPQISEKRMECEGDCQPERLEPSDSRLPPS